MSRGRLLTIAYFGALAVLLALILTGTVSTVLPGGLAGQVSRNSEGLLVVLAVSLWIQFVRVRPMTRPQVLAVALLAAAAWGIVGLVLLFGPAPAQLVTLNESAFALALLLPYLQLRRPLPLWGWLLLPVLAVAIPLIGGANPVTTDLAEAFGALFLIPLSVDAVDRGILDRSPVSLFRVLAWMAVLVGVVVALHAFVDFTPVGLFEEVTRYLSRVTEMIIASLMLHTYFSLLRPELRSEQPR